MRKVAVQNGASASYEFYFACLDRVDELITEKNSKVGLDEVVTILRTLSYFRPREFENKDKERLALGKFTQSEMQDDLVSVRHRQLIKKNSEKTQMLPEAFVGFLSDNIRKGMFKDMFTQLDEDQDSKLAVSLYDVMGQYL